jgi:hypothetical protein
MPERGGMNNSSSSSSSSKQGDFSSVSRVNIVTVKGYFFTAKRA